MTREEAHGLLDAACAGAHVTAGEITEALRATGDLSHRQPAHAESGQLLPFESLSRWQPRQELTCHP